MPMTAGAWGVSTSSSYFRENGSTNSGISSEFVYGSAIDVGIQIGVGGISGQKGDATGWGASIPWMGKYTGASIQFINGKFDGISLGLGVGYSSPVSYTVPLSEFMKQYSGTGRK